MCKCGVQGIPVFGRNLGWADYADDEECVACAQGWWSTARGRHTNSAEGGGPAFEASGVDRGLNSFEKENESQRGRVPRGDVAPGSTPSGDAARCRVNVGNNCGSYRAFDVSSMRGSKCSDGASCSVDQIVGGGRNVIGRHAPSMAIGSSASRQVERCRTTGARAYNSSGNRSRRCFSGCADVRFAGANPSSHTWRGGALDIAHVNTHRHIDTP